MGVALLCVLAGWLGRASFTSPEDAGYGSGSGFWLLDYLLMWIEVFVRLDLAMNGKLSIFFVG